MKISVIVVTLDEERRLRDCLESLKRFDDVLVVDLGSADHSAEIAQNMGFMVIEHPRVPIGEMVLPAIMPNMQNDWVIRVDPDEVLPPELIDDLLRLEVDDIYGIISVPYQYYFMNKRLDTTVWGGIRLIPRVINRNRVNVTADVHRGLKCKPGYQVFALQFRPGNAVRHYWIDSYSQLWRKHWRYIRMEGKARYEEGNRFNLYYLFMETAKALYIGLIKKQGWRGGLTGIFLSLFYAWYIFMSALSLAVYQLRRHTITSK